MLSFPAVSEYEIYKSIMFMNAKQGNFSLVLATLEVFPNLVNEIDPFDKKSTLLDHIICSKDYRTAFMLISPIFKQYIGCNEESVQLLINKSRYEFLMTLLREKLIQPNTVYPSYMTILDMLEEKKANANEMLAKNVEALIINLSKHFYMLNASEASEESVLNNLEKRAESLVLDLIDPSSIPEPKARVSKMKAPKSKRPTEVKWPKELSKSKELSWSFQATPRAKSAKDALRTSAKISRLH